MIIVRDVDVVVVGSGIAGMTAALSLAPREVVLMTKTEGLPGGSSLHAQGGIAAALGPKDSPDDHAADTVAAGAGLVEPEMARLLTAEGAAHVAGLAAEGVPFDRKPDGTLSLGREAAHGQDRIVHAGGDATGRVLVEALAARVLNTPSILVETRTFVVELVTSGPRVTGVLAHGPDGWVLTRARAVVLATGGVGHVFARTTNPVEATGDGLALAARAGARLADVEFVQFHPTAIAADTTSAQGAGANGAGDRPAALLTEALRGSGALLLDQGGRRFMPAEHQDAELAPRDVVARAIGRRIAAGQTVFLDLRPALAARPDGFPTVLALCAEAGLDPWRAPVPVAPAAHYHMGGIATDADGRTSLAGLWACGEAAATGVHGANRLASNSLLEALVFGARVASAIGADNHGFPPPVALPQPPAIPTDQAALAAIVAETRQAMYEGAGLVREAAGLRAARARLSRLENALGQLATGPATSVEEARRWGEARNRLTVGRLILHAALAREESRGAHHRADFPTPAAQRRRSLITLDTLAVLPAAIPPVNGDIACRTL